MAQQWFYKKDGTKHGPVTSQQLKQLAVSGELRPSDSVCRDGREEWKPAKAVKGLFAEESVPMASVPADVAPTATDDETQTATAFGRVRSVASRLGAAAKSAAIITAKQAEQAKIQNVSLPSAYAALGGEVYAAGSLRDEFQNLFEEVDAIEAKITDVEERSKNRPQGESFTEKAKAVGATASDKAEVQGQRLRLSRNFAKLGQAAYERHGKESGPSATVDNIQQLLKRSEILQSEIDTISQHKRKTNSHSGFSSLFPSWIYSWRVGLVALTGFLILGAIVRNAPERMQSESQDQVAISEPESGSTGREEDAPQQGAQTAVALQSNDDQIADVAEELERLVAENEAVFLLSLLPEDLIRLTKESGGSVEDLKRFEFVAVINGKDASVGQRRGNKTNFEEGFTVSQSQRGVIELLKHEFHRSAGLATNDYTKVVIREAFSEHSTYEKWTLLVDDKLGPDTIRLPKYIGSVKRIK